MESRALIQSLVERGRETAFCGRMVSGMKQPVAPRIYRLPATAAPVVAVLRRGPSHWSHMGRWDLETRSYQPGA